MTDDELKKLRAHYHSLIGLQRLFEQKSEREQFPGVPLPIEATEYSPVAVLAGEIGLIEASFPGLLPPFDERDFHIVGYYYKVGGIRAYLASAVARLKVAVDVPESMPVTQTREFSFVADAELRRVLERDYQEIQRAYIAKCWKSVMILSGGAIEAILLDRLQKDLARAVAATSAPRQSDLTRWDLANLIDVCVELGFVTPGAQKLSHSVREYRNLIHPGNEIRNKLTFSAEEAKIALEVLHIVHRDLSS